MKRKPRKRKSTRKFQKFADLPRIILTSDINIFSVLSCGDNYEFYSGNFKWIKKKISSNRNVKGMMIYVQGAKNFTLNKIKKTIAELCRGIVVGWYWNVDVKKEPVITALLVK